MWNYAQLTKAAKLAGGPEKFVKALKAAGHAAGYAAGRKEQLLIDAVVVLAIGGSYAGYRLYKLINSPIKALENKI